VRSAITSSYLGNFIRSERFTSLSPIQHPPILRASVTRSTLNLGVDRFLAGGLELEITLDPAKGMAENKAVHWGTVPTVPYLAARPTAPILPHLVWRIEQSILGVLDDCLDIDLGVESQAAISASAITFGATGTADADA
jgi:hypothetical protein